MITRVLEVLSTIDKRITIGFLVVMPIVIAYLHYRHRIRRYETEYVKVSEIVKPLFSDQKAVAGEEEEVGADTSMVLDTIKPHSRNARAFDHGLGHFNETDDNLGFRRYNEPDDVDLLEEEVVEITLDLGRMEENVRRFFARMHRVTI